MAVHVIMHNMDTRQQRVEVVEISPGWYCRTQIFG